MKRTYLAALLAALFILSLVGAQNDAGITLDIIGIDSTDLDAIAVHASILDSSQQLVSHLGVDNFRVTGDLAGLAQVTKVENIRDDELPFATTLVIDTSSSMADMPLTRAKEAAVQYIEALGPDDPVAIVTFSSRVRQVIGFTTDRDLLLDALEDLEYGGQTALYDATYAGILLAADAPLPRRAVVILSDGGEYGNQSERSRDESVKAATVNGVPVYTVGLGWNIDERFLRLVSSETNADFIGLPRQDELVQLAPTFRNLADLFRTQYIITLSADLPRDGKRYDFGLEVITDDGYRAVGEGTLRAPIPVPLLFLPDEIFAAPLEVDTPITVEIRADQEIESVEIELDGELVSTEPTYTIEPIKQAPGEHQLDITVIDIEGDEGRLSKKFIVAALPPTLGISQPEAEAPVEDPEVVEVEAGGQTEIVKVEFFVDGELYETDTEAPYEFNLDPFELSPEEHILTIRATNAAGQVTEVDRKFEVPALTPRLEIEGVETGAVISDRVSGSAIASGQGQAPIASLRTDERVEAEVVDGNRLDFTIVAAAFPPGRNTVSIVAVDEMGAQTVIPLEIEVAALPPTVEIEGIESDAVISAEQPVEVRAGGQTEVTEIEVRFDGGPAQRIPIEPPPDDAETTARDEVFDIPAQELGDGAHTVEVTVRNEAGESESVTLDFVVALPPTETPTFTPTFTPLPSATPTATEIPSETPTATFTATAVPATATNVATVTPLPPTNTVTPLPPTDTETPLPPTETITPLPPTNTVTPLAPTETITPLPPTDTITPLPPTETITPLPTDTITPLPTDTVTPSPPTDTITPLPTDTITPLPTDTHTPMPTDTITPVPTETVTPLPPTDTDTPVPTDTSTPLPTDTDTPVPTDTSTPVPTETDTPIPTDTNTPLPTDTNTPPPPTDTMTPLPTDTNTPLPPTETMTPLPTDTSTPVPTDTNTPPPTDTNTPPPTDTNTPEPTDTNTPIPTDTNTPIPTDTNTPIPTNTNTPVPTESMTPTPTDTITPIPTDTNTPIPTDTNTPIPTDTNTPVPTETDTPEPTESMTPLPTDTNTPIPTDTNTPVPTDTNTPVPTDTSTPEPTDTNTPEPTDTNTPEPTETHTPIPTDTNTPEPTDTNTPEPTDTNTPIPTDTNTPIPTDTNTPEPTDTNTPIPTDTSTPEPTETDTPAPTDTDTPAPTADVTGTTSASVALTVEVTGTVEREATAAATPSDAPPTDEPTAAPAQATQTDAPTDSPPDPTAQPTLTPVTITEIDAPSADDPDTRDSLIAILAVAAGLLLLLLLFLLSRRSRSAPPEATDGSP